MTRIIRAHFDGKVLVPDEPVDLPVGRPLHLHVQSADGEGGAAPDTLDPPRPLSKLADLADAFEPVDDAPTDLASQVDHYLYGHPKQP